MNETGTGQQDAADMQRLVAGHDAALNDLMVRHGERLFHYLIRQLHDEEDAADLAQETFVRVYRHCTRFNPAQAFSTWLYTIATNLARDRLKWRARHPQVSLHQPIGDGGSVMADVLPDARPLPDDALVTTERTRTVRDAVARLPEELRTPLLLSEYELLPNAEIARVLGCSLKAAESRLYRARQRLREELAEKL